MTRIRQMIVLLALAALAGCVPEVDVEAEEAALLQTDEAWAAVALEGEEIDRIVSYWADDATFYPPAAPPVQGKEALRQFVSESLEIPGFSISWEPAEVVVAPGGGLGYTTGENAFTAPDSSGNLVTMRGRYVTIWRKESDGSWKCVVDIFNEGPSEEM
jgi:ketosteroid isomerase-like protein